MSFARAPENYARPKASRRGPGGRVLPRARTAWDSLGNWSRTRDRRRPRGRRAAWRNFASSTRISSMVESLTKSVDSVAGGQVVRWSECNTCGREDARVNYDLGYVPRPAIASERSSTEPILMKMHLRRRFIHCRLVAGLLLASCTWLSSTASWAGCSHLVKGGANAPPSVATRLDRLVSLATFADDTLRSAPLDQRAPTPCSGVRCSGRSSLPLTMPQAQVRSYAWACVEFGSISVKPTSSRSQVR